MINFSVFLGRKIKSPAPKLKNDIESIKLGRIFLGRLVGTNISRIKARISVNQKSKNLSINIQTTALGALMPYSEERYIPLATSPIRSGIVKESNWPKYVIKTIFFREILWFAKSNLSRNDLRKLDRTKKATNGTICKKLILEISFMTAFKSTNLIQTIISKTPMVELIKSLKIVFLLNMLLSIRSQNSNVKCQMSKLYVKS